MQSRFAAAVAALLTGPCIAEDVRLVEPGHLAPSGNAAEDAADAQAIAKLVDMNEGLERDGDHLRMFADMEEHLAAKERAEAQVKRDDSKAIAKATWLDTSNANMTKEELIAQAHDVKKLNAIAVREENDARALDSDAQKRRDQAQKLFQKVDADLKKEQADGDALEADALTEGSNFWFQPEGPPTTAPPKPQPPKPQQDGKAQSDRVGQLAAKASARLAEKNVAKTVSNVAKQASLPTAKSTASPMDEQDELDAEQMARVAEIELQQAEIERKEASKMRGDGQAIRRAAKIEVGRAAAGIERAMGDESDRAMLRKAVDAERAERDSDADQLENVANQEQRDAEALERDAKRVQADAEQLHRAVIEGLHAAAAAKSSSITSQTAAIAASPHGHASVINAVAEQSVKAEAAQRVSCGGHEAASCAACPGESGGAWCHGDCQWAAGLCVLAGAQQHASFVQTIGSIQSFQA